MLCFTDDPVAYLCATFYRSPSELFLLHSTDDWLCDLLLLHFIDHPVTYLSCYILQITSDLLMLHFTEQLVISCCFPFVRVSLIVLHCTDQPVTYLCVTFYTSPSDLHVREHPVIYMLQNIQWRTCFWHVTDHPVTYLYNTLFYYEKRLSSVPLLKRRLVNAIIGQLLSYFVVLSVCLGETEGREGE